MGKIKRTPADDAFSKCIRAAANYTCERCGTPHLENSMGLHCSHHHSRGNWSIRLDPMNAEALCYGCHSLVGGTEERRLEVLTDGENAILWEKKADVRLAKEYKKTKGKGAVAKHYRDQYKAILEKRELGVAGYIPFVAWI